MKRAWNKLMGILPMVAALMVGAQVAAGDDLVLVRNGEPMATIVYPVRPLKPEGDLTAEQDKTFSLVVTAWEREQQASAEWLKKYILKISGAELPVVTDDKPVTGTRIHVGPTRAIKELEVDLTTLPGDSFIMRVAGDNLVLAGIDRYQEGNSRNNKRGTFYAVQAFLEDICAARWFMPGELGEDLVAMRTITVPRDLDRTDIPSIKVRQMASVPGWRARNKANNSITFYTHGGHTWDLLVPPGEYFEEHPEYFALIDDKRTVVKEDDPTLCTSNPDVRRIAVENVRAIFDRGIEVVELGHPDAFRQGCQCEPCMAISPDTGRGLGARIWDLHLQIASEVKKSHPHKMVLCTLYGPSRAVPEGIERFPDNVTLQVSKPSDNSLAKWSKYGARPNVYVYHWTTYWAMGYGPKASIRQVIDDMAMYRRHNVLGIYWCGGANNWGLEGVQYWLAARLQWNWDLDSQKLLEDYFSRFYRNAGKPMRAFFELLDDRKNNHLPEKDRERRGRFMRDVVKSYTTLFPPDVIARMDAKLEKAKKQAAGDDVVLRRIELTEAAWRHVTLTTAALAAGRKYDETKALDDLVALRDAVEKRKAFVLRILEAQEQGDWKDLTNPFGKGRASLREEMLYGEKSYFGDWKQWQWDYDEKIAEAASAGK